MSKTLMIQGTMSNAGKSILVAGLCRVYQRRGFKVAPFKSQNMALNSFITDDGLEMGRAQVVQAQAAKIEPNCHMNPILLKPVSTVGSQVIVRGKVLKTLKAAQYYEMKHTLIETVMESFQYLSERYDLIIIEGAGSPAEINLKKDDFVNMGLAKMVKSPVLLVGDIDRGGVFAQLYGTIALLEENERALIKGLIINKFRGDLSLLTSGLTQIEELTEKKVIGTLPFIDIDIDDEDSQSDRFNSSSKSILDIVVIKLKYMSNFSDFTALSAQDEIGLRYVDNYKDLGNPDLIILPGTKNTIKDLHFIKESGLESVILKAVERNIPIFGICGGYQLLGEELIDEKKVENAKKIIEKGLSLLPISTIFKDNKKTIQSTGSLNISEGILKGINIKEVKGYEIHMGRSKSLEENKALILLKNGEEEGCQKNSVYGTYFHGIFDNSGFIDSLITYLCRNKGINRLSKPFDYAQYKDKQYDILADALEASLDFEEIDRIIQEGIK